MKMGADPSDRMYEELTDLTKLQNILNDVSSRVTCGILTHFYLDNFSSVHVVSVILRTFYVFLSI